jgi:hypothetical protein
MGMSIYGGKIVSWPGDTIGLGTRVQYQDQNGNSVYLDMRALVGLSKQCKSQRQFFDNLEHDIESGNLGIGFPVIQALNDIGRELGTEVAMTIVKQKKTTRKRIRGKR